jgi:hypothetical protein
VGGIGRIILTRRAAMALLGVAGLAACDQAAGSRAPPRARTRPAARHRRPRLAATRPSSHPAGRQWWPLTPPASSAGRCRCQWGRTWTPTSARWSTATRFTPPRATSCAPWPRPTAGDAGGCRLAASSTTPPFRAGSWSCGSARWTAASCSAWTRPSAGCGGATRASLASCRGSTSPAPTARSPLSASTARWWCWIATTAPRAGPGVAGTGNAEGLHRRRQPYAAGRWRPGGL